MLCAYDDDLGLVLDPSLVPPRVEVKRSRLCDITWVDLAGVDLVVCPASAEVSHYGELCYLVALTSTRELPLLLVGPRPAGRDPTLLDGHAAVDLVDRIAVDTLERYLAHLAQDCAPPRRPRPSAVAAQLELPLDALARRSLVRLGSGSTVLVMRIERGVQMEARTPDGDRSSLRVALTPTTIAVESTSPLERGAPVPDLFQLRRRDERDMFSDFADAIASGDDRAALDVLVLRARIWLARELPRRARATGRRFRHECRTLVALRVAADRTGRLAQLAQVCPAIFALSRELAVATVLGLACERASAGERVRGVLGIVLDAWAASFHRTCPLDQSVVDRHAAFLLRAGPRVAGHHLSLPFPAGLALDDVPPGARDNEAWFSCAAELARLAHHAPELDAHRLAPFVSARAGDLWQLRIPRLRRLLRGLANRGHHLGRWPSRRTPVASALEIHVAWCVADAARALRRRTLPPPRTPDLRVRPLDTVAAIAAEAELMHHCLADELDTITTGGLLAFAVEHRGERLTAAVSVGAGRTPVLWDLAGRFNAEASEEARAAVEGWLSTDRADPTPPHGLRAGR